MPSTFRRSTAALLAVSMLAMSSLSMAQPQGPRDERRPGPPPSSSMHPSQNHQGRPGMHQAPGRGPGQAVGPQHRPPGYAKGHGYGPQGRPGHPGGPHFEAGRGAGPDHSWRRGGRVPPQYRSYHYVVNDWRGHHLSAPPRGYQWVQYGSDYLLVAIATGVIAQLILSQ
jgi:Ni/Co efflux regulator RcnB